MRMRMAGRRAQRTDIAMRGMAAPAHGVSAPSHLDAGHPQAASRLPDAWPFFEGLGLHAYPLIVYNPAQLWSQQWLSANGTVDLC